MTKIVGGIPPLPPPLLVFVDIDGTVVGDVEPQLTQYQLLVQSNSAESTRKKLATLRGKAFRDQVVLQLADGLLRPGFGAFCLECARRGVPVFLYTASQDSWARFLAPLLVRAARMQLRSSGATASDEASIKIAKLYARRWCRPRPDGTYGKSIALVGEDAIATLRRTGRISAGAAAATRLLDRCILIDNSPRVLTSSAETARLVVVPTYEYTCMYDVTHLADPDALHRKLPRAIELLANRDSFLRRHSSLLVPPPQSSSAPRDGVPELRARLAAALARATLDDAETFRTARKDHVFEALRKCLFSPVDQDGRATARRMREAVRGDVRE